MAAPAKAAFTLVSYYMTGYKEKYEVAAVVNRYSARWGFDAILQDLTVDETKSLVDYYFTTPSTNGHDLQWFFSNYHRLLNAKQETDKDVAALAFVRAESKRRAEEWRNRIGNRTGNGTEGS